MSTFRVCDKCGNTIGKVGWLAIDSFHLNIDLDLCEKCANDLVAWVKS